MGGDTPVRGQSLTVDVENSINRRVFETSLDLIMVTDRGGRILRISPSVRALLGYAPAEVEGHVASDFIHPEDLDPTRSEMRVARKGRATRYFDCRYMHRDGHAVALNWTGVWSEADQHHFFIGRDMTEVNRIAGVLRQSQKMEAVGQLTGGLAHDFNNILLVILGNLDVIEEAHDIGEDTRAMLAEIGSAALRAAELTRQLLAFSRQQPLQPEITNLNELVAALGKLLRRTLGEQIVIDERLSPTLSPTVVDRTQFESALLNLCVNARDAMPLGGRLMVETGNVELDEDYAAENPDARPGRYAMLAVTDTGTGMSRQVLEHVFEPFFTTKEVGKGTGLGLSMVYGFIKQSHGHIKIYSEVGQGTSVKIYLPAAAGQHAEDAPARGAAPAGGGERVLLVEDDAQVRASVRRQLDSLGYRVSEVDSGEAARRLLGEDGAFAFDLVLSDVVMPGKVNGIQLAEAIARTRPDVRIILMSGYTENAMLQDGRLGEGTRLLIKPFRKVELAQALREALSAAR
ncbi:MAG: response regulator [Alphaproteobacteria bacterium]|nr:response regulator [Alphaproteobacteria bacterium]MCW5741327.1 response regulator [Alphaproteobacteria bacterium]